MVGVIGADPGVLIKKGSGNVVNISTATSRNASRPLYSFRPT